MNYRVASLALAALFICTGEFTAATVQNHRWTALLCAALIGVASAAYVRNR